MWSSGGGGGATTASQVTNIPAGTISATNVQAAINEDASEKAQVFTYAGNPNDNVTPSKVGDICIDTDHSIGYYASDATNSGWLAF